MVYHHAVPHLNGPQKFRYDANGNMITCNVGTSYTYGYDAENRLTSVSGGTTASFVYDGDGARVKGTAGGVTTAYVGNYLEWTTSTTNMVKYYYAGIKRVAMSTGSNASLWLMGDHDRKDYDSGSTSVSYDVSSQTASIERYLPWGGLRDGTNSLTADGPPSINRQRLPGVRIRISSLDYPLRPAFMTFMGSLLSGTENATCQKN